MKPGPDNARERAVGRIARSHGIGGEVAVDVRTDDPDERFAPGRVVRGVSGAGRRDTEGAPGRELTVESVRGHGGRLLIRFRGIEDRTAADALRGTVLVVGVDDLPAPDDPDEFYDHQLEGLEVRLSGRTRIGEISDVLHTGGGELLSVRLDASAGGAGHAEVLVPFVAAIVTRVALSDGYIVVDPPDGLLGGGPDAQD